MTTKADAWKTQGQVVARRARIASCTHINMDRVNNPNLCCFLCGRHPSMGFLYVCSQDKQHGPTSLSEGTSAYSNLQHRSDVSQLRRELSEIGLSESVIRTAEQGLYTPAQLERLKNLKLDLKKTIDFSIQGARINAMAAQLADAMANGPSNNDGAPTTLPIVPACHFQACHTCRPFYKDRHYSSFGAMLTDAHFPVTPSEANHLPTKDARILRRIGLLPNPQSYYSVPPTETVTPSTMPTTHINNNRSDSPSSEHTFRTTQTDISLVRRLRHPRHRFYTLQNKSSTSIVRNLASQSFFSPRGLRASIKDIFKNNKPQNDVRDPPPLQIDSTITLPLPRSGTARSLTTGLSGETVTELDVRPLRRVRRQMERIGMRKAELGGGFEMGPRVPSAAAFAGGHLGHNYSEFDSSGYDSASSSGTVYSHTASEGSEMEVDGGVALTEEAVEMHTPDILDTTATMTATADSHIEVDVGGDVLLQLDDTSIMAQV